MWVAVAKPNICTSRVFWARRDAIPRNKLLGCGWLPMFLVPQGGCKAWLDRMIECRSTTGLDRKDQGHSHPLIAISRPMDGVSWCLVKVNLWPFLLVHPQIGSKVIDTRSAGLQGSKTFVAPFPSPPLCFPPLWSSRSPLGGTAFSSIRAGGILPDSNPVAPA